MKIRCSCAATSAQFSVSSFPFSMRTHLPVKQTGKIKNLLGRVQRRRFGRTNTSKQSQIFVFLALVPEKCTQSNSTEQQTPESKTNRAPPPPHGTPALLCKTLWLMSEAVCNCNVPDGTAYWHGKNKSINQWCERPGHGILRLGRCSHLTPVSVERR